ncbi:hypothetical protein AX16_008847 [Volvariella volvacea WC 439]|nr:hypothetical protein AX16_008847 [Volvariella volvacea WC 439]
MKSFIPIESNPDVFTKLSKNLGLKGLQFYDVFTLTEPDLLALIPRPVLGLVLVFPTTPHYKVYVDETEAKREPYTGSGEDIIWYRQTIHNACGLFGILHTLSNGKARDYLEPGSVLANILKAAYNLPPDQRAQLLEDSKELEVAHTAAAKTGDSAVPESAEIEVDYHYIGFTRSNANGHVYELDGAKKGPIDTGVVLADGEDLLNQKSLKLIQDYVGRENGENIGFNLLALAPEDEGA